MTSSYASRFSNYLWSKRNHIFLTVLGLMLAGHLTARYPEQAIRFAWSACRVVSPAYAEILEHAHWTVQIRAFIVRHRCESKGLAGTDGWQACVEEEWNRAGEAP